MYFHNPLDERQPNAGPLPAWVKLLEQLEYPTVVAWVDALPVIAHENDLFSLLLTRANLNEGLRLAAHVARGVFDQVLQHFAQAQAVSEHSGKSGQYLDRYLF